MASLIWLHVLWPSYCFAHLRSIVTPSLSAQQKNFQHASRCQFRFLHYLFLLCAKPFQCCLCTFLRCTPQVSHSDRNAEFCRLEFLFVCFIYSFGCRSDSQINYTYIWLFFSQHSPHKSRAQSTYNDFKYGLIRCGFLQLGMEAIVKWRGTATCIVWTKETNFRSSSEM